jgi:hypothetical protein
MFDEIMQELWPKFEKDFKRYAEYGPCLIKVGWAECRKEAMKRLTGYARLSRKKKDNEVLKRLVFREIAILIYMLHHLGKNHKKNCGCCYCYHFRKFHRTFYEESRKGKQVLFFDTANNFDGDVGFRLTASE